MDERKTTGPQLQVATKGREACVKVSGRATFVQSMDFKRILTELGDRGYEQFFIDLSECQNMDSTFLGVLAGAGLKHHASSNGQNTTGPVRVLNPNERIADLLENLGISHLFRVEHIDCPFADPKFSAVKADEKDKVELTRNCLEAHKTLMGINPDNVVKFKDVTEFLAGDLKKLESDKGPE